jgi:ABC-type transporter MlaC component
MNKFITDMREQVEYLDTQSAQLLEGFAKRVSEQTGQRMKEWTEQTNQYADSMVRAINTINNVVSEIDSKIGGR